MKNQAEISKAGGRVVQRSYNNSNAEGGVSCSKANNDASSAWANFGSRLANNKG